MAPFKDFRSIVDNNLITLSTDLEGNILFASKAYCDVSGYTVSELRDIHVNALMHSDISSDFLENIWSALRSESTWNGELKIRKKERGFYWVDVKVLPSFGEEGELKGFTAIMHDITDRKQVDTLMQRVAEEELLISKHAEIINDYVITSATDIEGTIISVSRAFCKISGYSEAELIGQNHRIIRHPDMPNSIYKDMWQTIPKGKEWKGELKNRTKLGDFYWVDVYIQPNKDQDGKVIGYTAVRQDITDKKKLEELSIKDELTGAYNRRFYNQVLSVEINRAKRNELWVGFLMVDADHFKKYNDTYGHRAGDEVLKKIVSTLAASFRRSGDHIFRLGGEEFAVLYSAECKDQLRSSAERARQAMYDLTIEHSGNEPHNFVTLSMGLMELDPKKEYTSEEIYKYADEALYRAKQSGRNCLELV